VERGEHPDVESMRRVYAAGGLDEGAMAAEPIDQFTRWFGEALAAGLPEPNAMVVATASAAGAPSARTVLLKGFSDRGFVFYTNLGSAKGRDLAENPQVALLFPWHALERQVRVTGVAQRLDQSEVERYFASRPRGSQLGAWASEQSTVIDRREVLAESFEAAGRRWPDGTPVPVPDFWGGFLVVPAAVEFWQGRESRLHDRLRYVRGKNGDGWRLERLAP
jgi:pyridoxamine 5'-phosphate oxidase